MHLDLSDKPKYLDEAIVWRVDSESRPGLWHHVIKLRHGGMVCTCEAHQFRGTCKHIERMKIEPDDEAWTVMRRWSREH